MVINNLNEYLDDFLMAEWAIKNHLPQWHELHDVRSKRRIHIIYLLLNPVSLRIYCKMCSVKALSKVLRCAICDAKFLM